MEYEIRIEGHIDPEKASWLGSFIPFQEADSITRLSGELRDQAALHGFFRKLRDQGIPLVSIHRIERRLEMKAAVLESSPNRLSRVAGIWYAALTVFSVIGMLYTQSHFLVPGDAAATSGRIVADPWLYRLGIVSNLAGQACFIYVGLAFHRLFTPVDAKLSRSMLALVIASVPIAFVNMVFAFAPLLVLGDASLIKAFPPDQLQSMAMLFFSLSTYGILVVSVFWGLWLLPLGILTFKSGYFPKILGVLLIVNFAAYALDCLLAFLFPDLREAARPVMGILLAIGEVPFLLWLLIRGARNPAQSGAAA